METTVSSLSTSTLLPPALLDSETPDSHLLREFVADQDEAAFAALVRRHGGLVRGVCRRILTDPAAADDAFQQTFLSLSQHAPVLLRTVAPSASLGSWLYRVAVNAALQLKRKSRSRRRTETHFAAHRPSAESPAEPWNEVLPALDEEISALPGQYRSAVVKCHLEGKTQQDAAKELGITYATLRRRLKEARGMLRHRLSKRGFTQNGFLLLPLLGQLAAPQMLSAQTVSTVTAKAVASAAPAAAVSATSATAASVGASVSLGTKILAFNPFIKLAVAAVFMLGAVGGWWIAGSDTSDDSESLASVASGWTNPEAGSQNDAPNKRTIQENAAPDAAAHFAYVLRNGEVVSPEFESAIEALTDREAKQKPPADADPLPLPRLENSGELLRNVSLGAPLPKESDLLSPTSLSQDVNQLDLGTSNAKLLAKKPAPAAKPAPKPDPLSVEQVMEFLNDEQARRSQAGFGIAMPASAHLLGHHNPAPAKTLKVIKLP